MSDSSPCTRCGAPVTAGARFCSVCGNPVAPAGEATEDQLLARLRQATLGEYDVLRELGRGGMAAVYLAWDRELARYVAIKVLLPELAHQATMSQRFLQEARTAANLDDHPSVVRVYRAKESQGLRYFVMKYVDGCSLDLLLRATGPLPVDLAVHVIDQVALALQYAHDHGVVHRDVKPGNVLLDRAGGVVVTDFGIAKVAEADQLTRTGFAIGTPHYMSPEQWRVEPLGPAADQYALGVVAYHMITGELPFEGTHYEIQEAHLRTEAAALDVRRPGVPPELAAVVGLMLGKRPDERFPDLRSVSQALAGIAREPAPVLRERIARLIPAALPEGGSAAGGANDPSLPASFLRPTPYTPGSAVQPPLPSASPITPWQPASGTAGGGATGAPFGAPAFGTPGYGAGAPGAASVPGVGGLSAAAALTPPDVTPAPVAYTPAPPAPAVEAPAPAPSAAPTAAEPEGLSITALFGGASGGASAAAPAPPAGPPPAPPPAAPPAAPPMAAPPVAAPPTSAPAAADAPPPPPLPPPVVLRTPAPPTPPVPLTPATATPAVGPLGVPDAPEPVAERAWAPPADVVPPVTDDAAPAPRPAPRRSPVAAIAGVGALAAVAAGVYFATAGGRQDRTPVGPDTAAVAAGAAVPQPEPAPPPTPPPAPDTASQAYRDSVARAVAAADSAAKAAAPPAPPTPAIDTTSAIVVTARDTTARIPAALILQGPAAAGTITLVQGDSVRLVSTVVNNKRQRLASAKVRYESSDPARALRRPSQYLVALAPGATTVTAVSGKLRSPVQVTVTPRQAAQAAPRAEAVALAAPTDAEVRASFAEVASALRSRNADLIVRRLGETAADGSPTRAFADWVRAAKDFEVEQPTFGRVGGDGETRSVGVSARLRFRRGGFGGNDWTNAQFNIGLRHTTAGWRGYTYQLARKVDTRN